MRTISLEQQLLGAIQDGNKSTALAILGAGANPNIANYQEDTPLHLAAKNGMIEVVETLLAKGARADVVNAHGATPLWYACSSYSNPDTALAILRSRNPGLVDVAHRTTRSTPLHLATENGWGEVVEVLFTRGARAEVVDANGRTPLWYACNRAKKDAALALLRSPNPQNFNLAQGDDRDTALHQAAKNQMIEVALALIAGGARADIVDASHRTPLHYAFSFGSRQDMALAILNSANPGPLDAAADRRLKTILHLATEKGWKEAVLRLLAKGVRADIVDNFELTPLWYACRGTNPRIALSILESPNPGDINVRSAHSLGATPLHLAAKNGLEEVVQELLRKGAKVNIVDDCGITPLWHACHSSDLSQNIALTILKLSDLRYINLTHKEQGNTPLQGAVEKNWKEVIQELLVKEADPFFITDSALHEFIAQLFADIAEQVRRNDLPHLKQSEDILILLARSRRIAINHDLGIVRLKNRDGGFAQVVDGINIPEELKDRFARLMPEIERLVIEEIKGPHLANPKLLSPKEDDMPPQFEAPLAEVTAMLSASALAPEPLLLYSPRELGVIASKTETRIDKESKCSVLAVIKERMNNLRKEPKYSSIDKFSRKKLAQELPKTILEQGKGAEVTTYRAAELLTQINHCNIIDTILRLIPEKHRSELASSLIDLVPKPGQVPVAGISHTSATPLALAHKARG